jgi:oxygen-independent coproporphyrinogen-3 oxidase
MCGLTQKYNVAGPRYTSYPTVPYWDEDSFSLDLWKQTLKKSFLATNKTEGISLYIHLPFCESMCTFCGCNKRITKNHTVEAPYIEAVLKELKLYIAFLDEKPIIKQLHLGGGTPTFFSPKHLDYLLTELFKLTEKAPNVEFSFEGHPNNTTVEHLKTFASHGFKRVCYGVQDYNLKVQKAIHRVQPFTKVKEATENARLTGYSSVGHDIIYGLPFQTIEDVNYTIDKTIELKPDRIAFYSYAHVPWIKGNGQRGFKDEDLPSAEIKQQQYSLGKERLINAGYIEIGMDHFALKTDELYKALENNTLHRNFMGYNANKTDVMIGLGVSSISDSWFSFAQNVKDIETYYDLLNAEEIPVYRGHILTSEDLIIRQHILNLMCDFETSWDNNANYLKELENDGLLEFENKTLKVTVKGKAFVRNICLPFDLRLQRKKPKTQLFSMTV